MTVPDRVAVIPVPPPGHYRDAILSDAIAVSPLSEYFEGLQQSTAHQALLRRLDEGQKEAARVERQQEQNRIRQTLTLCDSVAKLSRRMDAYSAELAIQRQREADEAEREEQERIQRTLDQLPDPDDPTQHVPGGELSPVPPKPQEDDEGQGDLPRSLEKGTPPPTGNFTELEPVQDPAEGGYPPKSKQVPPPTAVSFW
jgi:hypothetical protein